MDNNPFQATPATLTLIASLTRKSAPRSPIVKVKRVIFQLDSLKIILVITHSIHFRLWGVEVLAFLVHSGSRVRFTTTGTRMALHVY
jgi:hypothetical protein